MGMMMMEMMVAMMSARTTRTSAINIKKNAMRNITNRNAQRPVANVEEMMVVMTVVMMVSARICGMQRNAKSQRKIAKRMTTLPKIANKHADCAMMMMVMMVAMMDVKNWRNTDARHARCWSAANAH